MNKIKNKINIKSIILLMILTILIVLINFNKSNAFEYANLTNLMSWGIVGDTLEIGYTQGNAKLASGDTSSKDNLYCIQHGTNIGKSKYTVIYYVKIQGNHAISSHENRENTNSANAKLAYIIGGGNYSYGYGTKAYKTDRQRALWHYWNTWITQSGSELGIDWNADGNESVGANAIDTEAENYANSNAVNAQITSNVGNIIETSNEKAGAFNVSYTGNISSVVVSDINGDAITDGISFEQNGSIVQANSIVSGQDFYINNTSGRTLKNITINVSSSGSVINAELWLLKNSTYGWQRLMAVKPEVIPNSTENSVTIEMSTNNTLRVVKYGISNSEDEKQTGVEFVIYKNGSGYLCSTLTNLSGKMTFDNTNFYWGNDRNTATRYKTGNTSDGWDGYFQITGLPSGTYFIGEVYNPNKGFEDSEIINCNLETYSGENQISTVTLSNIQHNENISGYKNAMQVISTTLENGYTKILRIYDGNPKKTSLTINKSSNNGKGLKAGFILYAKDKEAFVSENTSDGYTTNSKKAKVYYTNSNGTRVIQDLDYDTYYIFEVEAPSGYSLSKQDGYNKKLSSLNIDAKISQDYVYCGKVTLTSNRANKTVEYTNKSGGGGGGGGGKTYRNITGYVWLDSAPTKNGQNNNIYDSGEKRLSGIKVILKNKSESTVTSTTTNDNGEYSFNRVRGDLSNYYVEFEYDSSKYAIVSPNYQNKNGSKVTSNEKSGIATTYTGRNNASENKYGLTAFYNSSTSTAENVNMGLIEVPESTYEITQNIAYVEITMNGYTYRYNYGGTGKVLSTVPTVNWEGTEAYTRNIYPSDILYNIENKQEALKINVAYRIDIINTTNTNIEYVYMEKNLQITNLIDTYDHDRYTLFDDNWIETDGNAKIKNNYLQTINGNGLNPNQTTTAYITFKVNEKAIEDVLTNPSGVAENKNNPTKVTSSAYHNYDRKEEIIVNEETGETKTVTRHEKTSEQSRSGQARYLLFKLPETPRTISGVVFEDKDEKNEEVIGNGKYDSDKEGTISNVKVELLLSDKTTVSKLYQKDSEGKAVYNDENKLPDATYITGEDGKYRFEGVIPGDYYLRFTYGDGTQEIKQVGGNKEKVYSSAYKSTIVTSNNAKTGLETSYEPTKALWYMDLEEANYSIAVDNLEKRKEISETDIDYSNINSSYKDLTNAPTIFADTGMISIPVEYTKTSEGIGTTDYPSEFNKMNFGVIKMPEINLLIDKEITNVKFTLSNGQVLINGNPLSDLSYVSSLDSNPNQVGGSGYVRAEMNSDYIYGTTLLLTYGIKVTNDSDLTYVEDESDSKYGWYYKYGDNQYAKEATININDVIDYLDPMLTKISSNDNTLEELKVSELEENNSFKKGLLYLKESKEIDTNFEKIYNFKGFGTLTTDKGKDKNSASKTLELNASKLLSTNDDDLEFINYAQIVKVSINKLTYKNPLTISNAEALNDIIKNLNMTQDYATITITPPTGKEKKDINYIFVIIEIAVLATGVYFIKKKVLK